MRGVEWALAAFLLCSLVLIGLAGCEPARPPSEDFARVWDRPLLETPQQVWEAEATGRCAFRIGDEVYVASNLPAEYVEYSREYVRMP